MKHRRIIATRSSRPIAALLLALVVACAPFKQVGPMPPSDADIADAKAPLICEGREQCDRWWRTAQVWVVRNAGYKVQIATDAIIETYNPTRHGNGWAFQVTRSPEADGRELIEAKAICGTPAACTPAYESVVADFKRAVSGTP
jgi:hypothetical protein